MAVFADLPVELVDEILKHVTVIYYDEKNDLLAMRMVCKRFAEILKPVGLRTLQMDWTRMDSVERSLRHPLERQTLLRIGHHCEALNIDMMVARDEDECHSLAKSFEPLPRMKSWIEMVQSRYTMNESSFTPEYYHKELEAMLQATPNSTAVKLSLPYKMIDINFSCDAATFILANTFHLLANRSEDCKIVGTLALDNLSERSLARLWKNPLDVKNIMSVFGNLRHLSLSIRRQINDRPRSRHAFRLWEIICKAQNLESLCLIDVDKNDCPKSESGSKVCVPLVDLPELWEYHALPIIHHHNWQSQLPSSYMFRLPDKFLPNLTYLELRDVNVKGHALGWVLKGLADSLQELYLDKVYLKTEYRTDSPPSCLWVGLPDTRPPADQRWLAIYIRQIRMNLRVCRVSGLSYDCRVVSGSRHQAETAPYDLSDPCGPVYNRTLEQRFVEVVMGYKQPKAVNGSPILYYPEEPAQDEWALPNRDRPEKIPREVWDALVHEPKDRHLTSHLTDSVDGNFINYNQYSFDMLRNYINKVDGEYKVLMDRSS
ncbi:hypothetical protein F5Y02DRAFT_369270 [Annulohypoxylon stygium]|nr:hypothetical protein F5Y02DRAFT_369270 [Annulohypoxylon stygium]